LVVEGVAEMGVTHGTSRVQGARSLETCGGFFLPPPLGLEQTELDERGRIVGAVPDRGLELRRSLVYVAQHGIGSAEFLAKIYSPGRLTEPLAEPCDVPVIVPRFPLDALQVAAGDCHPWVEFQGVGKRRNRFGEKTSLIVEHAEVIVGPRVRRIDSPCQRS
jgi:hypothetical protein